MKHQYRLLNLLVFLIGSIFILTGCSSLDKARSLHNQGKDQEALKMAASYLEDDDPSVRTEAVKLIGNIGGNQAADLLMPMLDDEDRGVKTETVRQIGKNKFEKAARKLVAMSIAENGELYEEIISAIRKIGAPANDYLVKRYNQTGSSSEKKAYKRVMLEVGPSVAAAIAKSMAGKSFFENRSNYQLLIEFQNPGVANWMLDEIENEEVADLVVEGLVKLGNKAIRPVINKLRPLVNQEGYIDLKERLIKTLGDLKAKKAISLLEQFAKSNNERVANAAEFSLKKIRGF